MDKIDLTQWLKIESRKIKSANVPKLRRLTVWHSAEGLVSSKSRKSLELFFIRHHIWMIRKSHKKTSVVCVRPPVQGQTSWMGHIRVLSLSTNWQSQAIEKLIKHEFSQVSTSMDGRRDDKVCRSFWFLTMENIFSSFSPLPQVFQFAISREILPDSLRRLLTSVRVSHWDYDITRDSRWKLRKSEYYVFIFSHEYGNLLKANTNSVIYFLLCTAKSDTPGWWLAWLAEEIARAWLFE